VVCVFTVIVYLNANIFSKIVAGKKLDEGSTIPSSSVRVGEKKPKFSLDDIQRQREQHHEIQQKKPLEALFDASDTVKNDKPPPNQLLEAVDDKQDSSKYHMVFSTDCSAYQRWQSYILFYRAKRVGQPGKITRIASGCDDEESKIELDWHTKHISNQISSDYSIHLTPHFSRVKDADGKETDTDYKFFNKPFGVLHWMSYGPDMGFKLDVSDHADVDDTIVILIDPDMVPTRPITRDFPPDPSLNIGVTSDPHRVTQGHPFAQIFGFGDAWRNLDLPTITGDPSTPALDVSSGDARRHYAVGPPYIATASDMYRIVVKWAEYVPRVYAEHPHLMAEMYAFSIAAAHLELPHRLMKSMMMSDSNVEAEGWKMFEDEVGAEEMCRFGKGIAKDGSEGGMVVEEVGGKKLSVANVIHHCQRYMLGKWFFGKRRVPKDFFSCEKPLLLTPPDDLGILYDYRIPPPSPGHREGGDKKNLAPKQVKRETFMLCYLIQAMNEASTFYKEENCDDPNLEMTMELWKE